MDFLTKFAEKPVDLLSVIIVLLVICFIVHQCAKVHKDTVSNIGQFGSGDDSVEKKSSAYNQSSFNFYVVVGISFTILSAFLKLFNSTEVFVALFVAELTGLGIKLSLGLKK